MIHREEIVQCSTVDVNPQGGLYVMEDGSTFDTVAYSRLKYGSRSVAKDMGTQMGQRLLAELPEDMLGDTPPEAVVKYKAIAPACGALTRYCMDTISAERVRNGLEPGRTIQVRKSGLMPLTYASSTEEERAKLLASVSYDTDGHNFDEKPVIVIDDIRITGASERRTRKIIDEYSPSAMIFGYIALLNEAATESDTTIEDRINHTYVKSLHDILDIVKNDGFILNIRTLKRILSNQEAHNREHFFAHISDDLVYELYMASIMNGPEFACSDEASKGFAELAQHAKSRQIIA